MALGWAPTIPWEDGLRQTIEWYHNNVFGKSYWRNYEYALAPHPEPYKYG